MTKNNGLKRVVREYQASHPGMMYTEALKVVTRERDQARAAEWRRLAVEEPSRSRGDNLPTVSVNETVPRVEPGPSERAVSHDETPASDYPVFLEARPRSR